MARGIMWVMMSGAAAGCQADRARSVALGVVTGGGQSIPAALAAYLNVAFHSMLTPCRVGNVVPSSARGIAGAPRRSTEVVLNEQPLPVAWRSHDGIPRRVQLAECCLKASGRTAGIREPGRFQARGRFRPRVRASITRDGSAFIPCCSSQSLRSWAKR